MGALARRLGAVSSLGDSAIVAACVIGAPHSRDAPPSSDVVGPCVNIGRAGCIVHRRRRAHGRCPVSAATLAGMGIRYYAYAFAAERTEEALADPRAFISSDPLADAWGLEPHAALSVATFEPRVPQRDLLYLDKAWRELQLLTGPTRTGRPARPAYRMFEGAVTTAPDGYGWSPWVRALAPAEAAAVAHDLALLTAVEARRRLRRRGLPEADVDYAEHYLAAARSFMAGLERDGRGMAYLIG